MLNVHFLEKKQRHQVVKREITVHFNCNLFLYGLKQKAQELLGTCKLLHVVQCGDDWDSPPLQEEDDHEGEREVRDPGARDAAGDAVRSSPAAHSEHQVPHTRVQLSVHVQQLCALYCHPVENRKNVLVGFFGGRHEYFEMFMHFFLSFYRSPSQKQR